VRQCNYCRIFRSIFRVINAITRAITSGSGLSIKFIILTNHSATALYYGSRNVVKVLVHVVYSGIYNGFFIKRSSRLKIAHRAKLLLAFELIRYNSSIRKAKLVAKLFVLSLAYNLSPSVLPQLHSNRSK
jgi:hypothetical protein